MGFQPLSERRARYYERLTGLSLDRVLSHGGNDHWLSFRTPDHRHGWFRMHRSSKSEEARLEIIWASGDWDRHRVTCKEQFPLDFEPDPPYRYIGRQY